MLKEPSLPFHNYTGYSVTILSQRLQLASRDCRPGMDYDYTSSEFDSFRSQYVLSDSGLRLTGDSAITDAEHCYVCCVLNTSTSELVQKAFDNEKLKPKKESLQEQYPFKPKINQNVSAQKFKRL